MEEQWKPIIITKNEVTYDYTGLYEVSNLGRVKRLGNNKTRKERIMKPNHDNKGYVHIGLSKDGES